MNVLEQLAMALGLAGLAGINLYLTVFVAGLAIRCDWIHLAPQYHQLEVLAHTPVLVLAGVLYLLEFFADKIPWVDSLNDTIHTLIRPVGAAFLAIQVLGSPQPIFDVMIGLLAGSVALTTHTAKAGTRLLVNTWPEPFSNVALSITEDATVLGGLVLLHAHPFLLLGILCVVLALIVYLAPRIFRFIQVRVCLGWRKLTAPAVVSDSDVQLPGRLPSEVLDVFRTLQGGHPSEAPAWAVRCWTGPGRLFSPNRAGWMVGAPDGTVRFLTSKGAWEQDKTPNLSSGTVTQESRFLSENLVFQVGPGRKGKQVFFFERANGPVCRKIASLVQSSQPVASPARTVELKADSLK